MIINDNLLQSVVGGVNIDLVKRYSACIGIGLGVAVLTIAGFVGFVLWADSKKKIKCTPYPTAESYDQLEYMSSKVIVV